MLIGLCADEFFSAIHCFIVASVFLMPLDMYFHMYVIKHKFNTYVCIIHSLKSNFEKDTIAKVDMI